jgi:hypothetical protein
MLHEDRSPRVRSPDMPSDIDEPSALREADCPFCERTVVVYEEPPRCPLCSCPLDPSTLRPYEFPDERPAPSAD